MQVNTLIMKFENATSRIPLTKEVSPNGHIWTWDKKTKTLHPSINNSEYHVIVKDGEVIDCGSQEFCGELISVTECYRSPNGNLEKIDHYNI